MKKTRSRRRSPRGSRPPAPGRESSTRRPRPGADKKTRPSRDPRAGGTSWRAASRPSRGRGLPARRRMTDTDATRRSYRATHRNRGRLPDETVIEQSAIQEAGEDVEPDEHRLPEFDVREAHAPETVRELRD